MAKWMDSFQILDYIRRRMKACGVKRGERSCDCPERVFNMALEALKSQGKLGDKPWEYGDRELMFTKYGDVWAASLMWKEWAKKQGAIS